MVVKSVHFYHVLASCSSEHTCTLERIFLSYHAIVISEQLFLFLKTANVFHKIKRITDALKKIAHDQNEQTMNTVRLAAS